MAPKKDSLYRIQNVDFNTYLEIPGIPSTLNQPATMRLWKDSGQQRWTFQLVNDSDESYYIHNEAQKTYLGILSDSDGGSVLVSKSKDQASKWLLDDSDVSSSSDARYEIRQVSGENTNTYLQLGEFGSVYITDHNHDTEAQQWRIFSGSPPSPIPTLPATLVSGYYRIRNLNGFAILSFPTTGDTVLYPNVFVSEQDSDNARQRWYVKPTDKDNIYTIQTAVDSGDYLGVQDGDIIHLGTVRGLSGAEFSWELQNIGGFAYSINVNGPSPKERLAVGFASYQADLGNQAVLMPSSNAFSQIWLFEAWEKLSLGPSPAPYYADYALIQRENGWYNICSYASSSNYLYLNTGVLGSPHLAPVQASYFKTSGSFFIIVKDQLFQMKDRGAGYFAQSSDGKLSYTSDESSASWWYVKRDETTSAYYICLHEPGTASSVKVLGNNGTRYHISGINIYHSLPISDLVTGSTNQMWTFQ